MNVISNIISWFTTKNNRTIPNSNGKKVKVKVKTIGYYNYTSRM